MGHDEGSGSGVFERVVMPEGEPEVPGHGAEAVVGEVGQGRAGCTRRGTGGEAANRAPAPHWELKIHC